MLSLKPTVLEFLRCSIGDGRSATFWYDWWTDLGPLITALGSSDPRDLRIDISATVSDAVIDGSWSLPPARSDEAETLQVVLSTMSPPLTSNGPDKFLWRNGSDQYVPKFSSRLTWERIREQSATINWSKIVWFKEEIPRCSFITWLAFLRRLPTRDRLSSWGMNVPEICVLCSATQESHDHLFFRCPYAASVWSHFCVSTLSAPPYDLPSCSAILEQNEFTSSTGASTILKLLLQVIIYVLWRERNHRIFRDSPSPAAASIARVDRMIRDRLLSIPPSSSSSPSLLNLFFSFFVSNI
ncbi:hypothetical protein N665_0168s0012 [Sinapis alba]|nr:hypothetical protein N665_0168s0012 [Sinapis alba]